MSRQSLSAMIAPPRVVVCMGTGAPQLAERNYYRPLLNFIRELGFEVQCLSLPKLGLGDFQMAIDELEKQIFDHRDQPLVLIGHSQGASIVHALAHRCPGRVMQVIQLCPATHGTWLASLPLGIASHLAPYSNDLRVLRGLQSFPIERTHVVYTPFDQLIVPWFSSFLLGAHNVVIAPRRMRGVLARFGQQRRSRGVLQVHGYCDHISVVACPAVHNYIRSVLMDAENMRLARLAA